MELRLEPRPLNHPASSIPPPSPTLHWKAERLHSCQTRDGPCCCPRHTVVLGAPGLLEGTNASAGAESELGIKHPLACRTKPLLSLEEPSH